jgi:hypothetical protein
MLVVDTGQQLIFFSSAYYGLTTVPNSTQMLAHGLLSAALSLTGYFLLERRSCRLRWGVHLLMKLKQASTNFPR